MISLLLLLLVVACDRFEHSFEPEQTSDFQTIMFDPISSALENITATDVNPILSFYDDDYMHNGQTKTSRQTYYQSLFSLVATPSFEVTLLAQEQVNDTLAVANWRLVVKDNADNVISDSTFIGEQMVSRAKGWKLYGNRDNCCGPVISQRIFIEEFTYTTCPNCPVVEELLHQLQMTNPNNLTYLEYHINDPISPYPANMDIYTYYGNPPFPVVFFQGVTKIAGNNEDNEAVFAQLAQEIAAQQGKVQIANPDYAVLGGQISGNVQVNIVDTNVTQTNLKLKYALIDKVSADYTNNADEPCRNSVLVKGEQSLSSADLTQPVTFSMPYAGTIPTGDAYLVIWVQDIPAVFTNNAPVYNCIEFPVASSKVYKSKK
jgi:hypothetical protein